MSKAPLSKVLFSLTALFVLGVGCGPAPADEPVNPHTLDEARDVAENTAVDAQSQTLGYDVHVTVDREGLTLGAGAVVTGKIHVEVEGKAQTSIVLSLTHEGLPTDLMTQLMPAVLDASGNAVFSLRTGETAEASSGILRIQAKYGDLSRAATVVVTVTE
jgi:hypothetical protein